MTVLIGMVVFFTLFALDTLAVLMALMASTALVVLIEKHCFAPPFT